MVQIDEQPGPSNPSGSKTNNEKDNEKETNNTFECNICLDTARHAVISYCGHLFWYF